MRMISKKSNSGVTIPVSNNFHRLPLATENLRQFPLRALSMLNTTVGDRGLLRPFHCPTTYLLPWSVLETESSKQLLDSLTF